MPNIPNVNKCFDIFEDLHNTYHNNTIIICQLSSPGEYGLIHRMDTLELATGFLKLHSLISPREFSNFQTNFKFIESRSYMPVKYKCIIQKLISVLEMAPNWENNNRNWFSIPNFWYIANTKCTQQTLCKFGEIYHIL